MKTGKFTKRQEDGDERQDCEKKEDSNEKAKRYIQNHRSAREQQTFAERNESPAERIKTFHQSHISVNKLDLKQSVGDISYFLLWSTNSANRPAENVCQENHCCTVVCFHLSHCPDATNTH